MMPQKSMAVFLNSHPLLIQRTKITCTDLETDSWLEVLQMRSVKYERAIQKKSQKRLLIYTQNPLAIDPNNRKTLSEFHLGNGQE